MGFALITMSITKPVLNKINAVTTNCREAYTYGGNLTVAEMAFLDNMFDKKKETTESAEAFIEYWIQLSLQTGITRTAENVGISVYQDPFSMDLYSLMM